MVKVTDLIFSSFNVTSACKVPFGIIYTCIMHSSWTYVPVPSFVFHSSLLTVKSVNSVVAWHGFPSARSSVRQLDIIQTKFGMSKQVSNYSTEISRQKRTHGEAYDDGCDSAKTNGYEKNTRKVDKLRLYTRCVTKRWLAIVIKSMWPCQNVVQLYVESTEINSVWCWTTCSVLLWTLL